MTTLAFVTTSDPDYVRALELRYQVLRAPLGMSRDSVVFAFEDDSLHLVARAGEALVGNVSFHLAGKRLYQMAVAPQWQRHGVGTLLVRRLEAAVRERGDGYIVLHARANALGFYQKLGYVATGEFIEVGIAHHLMRKTL